MLYLAYISRVQAVLLTVDVYCFSFFLSCKLMKIGRWAANSTHYSDKTMSLIDLKAPLYKSSLRFLNYPEDGLA